MTRLSDRLDKLEALLDLPPPCDDGGPQLIRIRGGLPCDVLHATIGAAHIVAEPGESEACFIDRCFSIALEREAPFIVVAG